MFVKATPESAGISSAALLKYLKMINAHCLSAHSVLIARGDSLVLEAYWKPFDRSDVHRMYSQTKSFVGLAIRLLADEGRLSLDDNIISFFPDKLPETVHPWLEKQTVRNMLMMRTCFDEYEKSWFTSGAADRVEYYFSQRPSVCPGTQYRYDSTGSFVLGALVERLTGKTFLDYLRDKCLRRIGFSEEARCLYCPGGWAWGDSALLCTPADMLKYGRFIGRYGEWEGESIIPRRIIEEAFAERSDLGECGMTEFSHCGYISQFWNFYGNAVGFNGMHDQVTLYDPDTDITFACTSGNARGTSSRELMMSYLFTDIIGTAGEPLEESAEYNELEKYVASLELISLSGAGYSDVEKEINGKVFKAEDNPMNISEYSFEFFDGHCDFKYKNAQGDKLISIGRRKNVFGLFPETGYSDRVGGQKAYGHQYRCASSFAWGSENQLNIKIQIIDDYIGNLFINFSYLDGYGRIKMRGDAENFLNEYDGRMNAFISE